MLREVRKGSLPVAVLHLRQRSAAAPAAAAAADDPRGRCGVGGNAPSADVLVNLDPPPTHTHE